jgi:hypothetical protein
MPEGFVCGRFGRTPESSISHATKIVTMMANTGQEEQSMATGSIVVPGDMLAEKNYILLGRELDRISF